MINILFIIIISSLLSGESVLPHKDLFFNDSLFSAKIKRDNYKNIMHRGGKSHYVKNFTKPVGCVFSLNVQNIYNAVMKDLSLCEES